ncbi:MAG TPA: DUF4252 domain-containing protein [Pyrinomonadaceae bacterium]|nr:DUF4252 domain-containing protein [Pyrinomonadaceae bacterium]
MRTLISTTFKFAFALSLGAACSLAPRAQTAATNDGGRVQLESLDRLAPRAVETVNVQVDAGMIEFGGALLKGDDPEEKDIKELLVGLKGVYVRVLEFKGAGEYSDSDIAPLREQLRAPGWSRIVGVQSRKEGLENAEVYLSRNAAGRVDGLVFMAVEPKQIVFVNLVGTVDLEKLRRLEGNLGIPEVSIGGTNKSPKSNPPARKKP